MKSRSPYQILDEIAQQQIRQPINLSSGIQARVRKENRNIMKTKFVLSGILAIAIILVVMFTIPSVAQAMQRLFGYIPGTGLVQNNAPLRVLQAPVQIIHGDTTIKVEHGVVDTEHTTLLYQVENLPAFSSSDIKPLEMCHELPSLRLPDGSEVQGRINSSNGWVNGYNHRILFSPLPANVNSVDLVFSCLEQSPIVSDAQKWEIPLKFVDASANMTVYPLVDLPTPTLAPTEQPSTSPTTETTEGTPLVSDITLNVNRYVQTGDNIILFGALNTLSNNFRIELIESAAMHLHDSNGDEIPLEEDYTTEDPKGEKTNASSLQWTYRTGGRYVPGPATLTVDSAWVEMNEDIHFVFDPGENPQPGQEWTLNLPLVVAGRTIQIQSATMNAAGNGVSFTIDTPPDVSSAILVDLDHPLMPGGGGPNSSGFTYQDGFPTGKINVTLISVSVNISGPWSASIDLPAFTDGGLPTASPDACLTQSSWKTALEKHAPIPSGLNGNLALSKITAPDNNYHVMTAKLDGSQQVVHATGDGAALSPDNLTMIYNSDTGLQMLDLSTGNSTPLQNSWKNDRGALWSPDGTKIAFTRGPASGLIGAPGPYSIFIANPDGSQQQPLVENADANFAQTWLPDGQSLLYTVEGSDGVSLRSINVSSGQVTPLFNIGYAYSSVAISPDGKRVAYEQVLPGDHYAIFTANLDGTNVKLVVDAAPIVATIPQWSPDGNWLIVSVHDEKVAPDNPVLALIEVDTCQVVPLTSLKGYVSTWNP